MDVPPYNCQSPMIFPMLQRLFNFATDRIEIQNFTMFDKDGQPYVPWKKPRKSRANTYRLLQLCGNGHHALFRKVLPDCWYIPTIAVPGTGLRECGIMRTKLQGAVIAVLEESLAVDAKEFSCALRRDPSRVLSHWSGASYLYTLSWCKPLSTGLRKFLSLCFAFEIVWGN